MNDPDRLDAEEPSQPGPGEVPASPRVGLTLLLAAALGILGSAIAFARVGGSDSEANPLTGAEEFAVALPLLLALGGGALVATGLGGARPRRVLGLERPGVLPIAAGAVAGVALQGAVIAMEEWLISPILGEREGSAEELVDAFSGAGETVLLWVLVVGLAPIAEELFYRGALLPLVRRRWSTWWAVGIVAVLFSLSHLQGRQLPLLLATGMAFGALAIWRRSVGPAISAHMAFNAAGLAAVVLDLGGS